MQRVSIDDPAWRTTFPHPVEPLDDERLAGLLLRCDEENHWVSGTTLACIKRSYRNKQYWTDPNLIWLPPEMLDDLAQLLAVSKDTLIATTYQAEIARCYGTFLANLKQLTFPFPFRVCPQCLAQNRLLRLTLALPQFRCCPQHQLVLLETCQCGTPLQLFTMQAEPFTCHTCGLDWARLPRISANSERLGLEQKHLLLFAFFFTEGTPRLFNIALWIYRKMLHEGMEKKDAIGSIDRRNKYLDIPYQGIKLLAEFVAGLVRFDISPQDILTC